MGSKNFRTTFDFVRADADACIRCQCGYERRVEPKAFLMMFGRAERLEGAVKRLKCTACGKRGLVRIAALPHLD